MGSNLRPGLASNYVAFAVIAVTGLALNFIVLAVDGEVALGLFSQTYVVFVIGAQLSTAGLHLAVLHSVASDRDSAPLDTLRNGMIAVVPSATATAVGLFVMAPFLADAFDSSGLTTALRFAAIGLPLHSLTKVWIGFTNAVGAMHKFALYQAVRGVTLAGSVAGIAVLTDNWSLTALAFPVSEFVTLAVIAVTMPRPRDAHANTIAAPSPRSLFRFGVRAAGGGLVQETNARVDVLVLALFVSDGDVGVYTIAATLYEGTYQVLVVIRNNLNPLIGGALAAGDRELLEETATRLWRWVSPVALMLWVVALIAGPWILSLTGMVDTLDGLFTPAIVMLGALALVAPLVPFDQLAVVGGRPTHQTVLMVVVLAVNVIGNVILVPSLGLLGAATATAIATLVLGIGIVIVGRKLFGVALAHPVRR